MPSLTSLLAPSDQIRQHRRVAGQAPFAPPVLRRIADDTPELVPFSGTYHAVIAVLDWDHLLPSRRYVFRMLAYHSEASYRAGVAAYVERERLIDARDRYPEFDVPDFAGLAADEAYEFEVDVQGVVGACKLTSEWRREVERAHAAKAVRAVRGTDEFRQVVGEHPDRARNLGDLEPVGWAAPCETGHPCWTVDVWYLLSFEGRVGTGRSFLVDLGEDRVVSVRAFNLRGG